MDKRVLKYYTCSDESLDQAILRVARGSKEVSDRIFARELIPASPFFMNGGAVASDTGILLSDDALDISLSVAIDAHKKGSGCGFSFSFLSSPVEVLSRFDTALSTVLQAGKRSGANMALLSFDHPDVLSFIQTPVKTFNKSIVFPSDHMESLLQGGSCPSFDAVVSQAHARGDCGIIFLDRYNTPLTSSCAQHGLEDGDQVAYAHVNLAACFQQGSFQTELFVQTIDAAAKVLSVHEGKRAIGLLGFMTLLERAGFSYASDECFNLIHSFMPLFRDRCSFHGCSSSLPPTALTSCFAGVSPSIEPFHSLDDIELSFTIPWQDQLAVVASFQQYLSQSISKTVNLPTATSVSTCKEIFLASFRLGLKGMTLFRKNCWEEITPKNL